MKTERAYNLNLIETAAGLYIDDNGRRLYPYKKIDDGVYIRWIRWNDATPAAFKRALYAGRACAGPSIIWEYWKTVNATRRGRYIGK